MAEATSSLRWGVERRLEFIEFRLFWEGWINRGDLTRFFGVSVPQASRDLSQYQELAPGNMEYDKSEKRYRASSTFSPRFLSPDSNHFLARLQAAADQGTSPVETWLSSPPDLDLMPIPHRRVEPGVLRTLLRAVRERRAVAILYQSMNPHRAEPVMRGISPHAFASDGHRWHVRAFCHIDRKFKDFLLSRCLECRVTGAAEAEPVEDAHWNEVVKLRLKPNPRLSKSQRKVIATDYHMDNDELLIPVRKALLYYFQKRLRLDVAKALENPQETPVVIANKAVFEKALEETKA